MKVDTLPDPIPGDPGVLWINPLTCGLMISDGERYIPLAPLRSADAGRLAALIADLAVPPLPTAAGPPRGRAG